MKIIDLRSDTVTKPTAPMRQVMAAAEVGDDVYGEDPSVRALEEQIAHLLGKERALFVPSGTMSNQLALLAHTSRGDEVYIGVGSHCAYYESGAGAAWAGVQFVEVGHGGLFTAEELSQEIKSGAYWEPQPRLVVIENTHNRGGGRVFPQTEIARIEKVARARGLSMHLDGARIWNAAVATGLSLLELAAPFDSVSVCFSKGLGAPVGSALAGSQTAITRAHRFRKMLGGGMRQAGILAKAAEYGVVHHRERLSLDHDNAQALGARLAESGQFDVSRVETNIVLFDTSQPAASIIREAARNGVLVSAFGERRIRAVTHLDVSQAEVQTAARILVEAAATAAAPAQARPASTESLMTPLPVSGNSP